MVAERGGKSGGHKKKKSGYVRVGSGYADEAKVRSRIRGNSGDGSAADGNGDGRMLPTRNPDTGRAYRYLPSEPWVDTHFFSIDDTDADGKEIRVRFFDRGTKASPLNGGAEGMIRCPLCGRLTPPNALEGGRCLEHQSERIHEAYGGSPSSHAIRQLQHRNLRVEERKLPPDDPKSLQREIKRMMKKMAKKKYRWKKRNCQQQM